MFSAVFVAVVLLLNFGDEQESIDLKLQPSRKWAPTKSDMSLLERDITGELDRQIGNLVDVQEARQALRAQSAEAWATPSYASMMMQQQPGYMAGTTLYQAAVEQYPGKQKILQEE
ncbi:unnamed protein product [Vitrella brassicaformis CCMP3155]|uniref:Uncharacterized protein n=1 Tax=Vitrella brassicaformis (strain CCMP3155) TaxID=1169540 RepID=A0A0G4EFS3_VITBC|nr:unnamed protein product [Vitrella brassicaformis CCMP3155]|eukprot:CEL94269.1 unnamed protein product [Vitrella brassicaformis CCMP3155]